MFSKLAHTPVATRAGEIFKTVRPGAVTLLEGYTGSGKSLVSPLAVWGKVGGPVLVLVPGVDIARDNARRIAELVDEDWQLGREVGLYAGGQHLHGSEVVVATYGSFITNHALRRVWWRAILLDESHVEVWQVEVARADVHARLVDGEQLAVMEMSATMDAEKLTEYWSRNNIPVASYRVPDVEPPFRRELIHIDMKPVDAVLARLAFGDRFIMLTQPGLREVEKAAQDLRDALIKLDPQAAAMMDTYTYHADTEPEGVHEALRRLRPGQVRVVVTTPRLLTGFNHEDLDTVVTDGRAKYPHSNTNGAMMLKAGDMSRLELTQALGRVGRFKNGQLVLASDVSFRGRHASAEPEVVRLSSLPLAIALCCMGRDPLAINFCNRPRDLAGAMQRLGDWGFIDESGRPTELGARADELDIRLDLAKMLLELLRRPDATLKAKSAGIMLVAAVEAGGVMSRFDKEGQPIIPPIFDHTSDYVNEALRFVHAVRTGREKMREAGYSTRGVGRARGTVYRLLDKIGDEQLSAFFGDIFRSDNLPDFRDGESPKQKAWRKLGDRLQNLTAEAPVLRRVIIQAMQGKVYKTVIGRRGLAGVLLAGRYTTALGYESVVSPNNGTLFVANQHIIIHRNGTGSFPVLTEVTQVSMDELVAAFPRIYTVREERTEDVSIRWRFILRRTLLQNGVAVLVTDTLSPLTAAEEAAQNAETGEAHHTLPSALGGAPAVSAIS